VGCTVGIANPPRVGWSGVLVPTETMDFFFLFSKTGQTYCGGPPTLLFIRYQVSYPAIKQPWRKVGPSPPPNAEV
jgi:hypothetical protein